MLAWVRPAAASGPPVPRAPIRAFLKEHVHTDSSCRCWINLECAWSPSQNWHLKYRHLLIERQRSMHSVSEKQKLWRERFPNHFVDDFSNVHQNSKHNGKRRSFLSAERNKLTTPQSKPGQETPECPARRSASLVPKATPASVATVPTSTQSPPTYSSKDVSKTKKHLPQLKILLRQSGFQKLFVSSIKIDFWEMSNAISEQKRLKDATCLTCVYSLNTWKPGPRTDFSWHPQHFGQIKTSLDNNRNLFTSKVGWEYKKKCVKVPCK